MFDDFLAGSVVQRLRAWFDSERFRFMDGVSAGGFRKSDGRPLAGPTYVSDPVEGEGNWRGFPSGDVVDLFILAMRGVLLDLAPWVGRANEDWRCFSARPYVLGRGDALSWHTDKAGRTGAYTFFLHSRWSAGYGGELHIACSGAEQGVDVTASDPGSEGRPLDHAELTERLLEAGVGRFVVPKPNRLVVMKPGTLHAVRRVDADAGDWLRASISGFFLRGANASRRR